MTMMHHIVLLLLVQGSFATACPCGEMYYGCYDMTSGFRMCSDDSWRHDCYNACPVSNAVGENRCPNGFDDQTTKGEDCTANQMQDETLVGDNWKHTPVYSTKESVALPPQFDSNGDPIRGMIARDDRKGRRSLKDLTGGPDDQVDVLILYGNTEFTKQHGHEAIQERMAKLVLWSNYALENSGVSTAGFHLVGVVQLEDYLESQDPLGRDFFLYATGNAFVSQLREKYSADLVAFFCTDHHCGGALQSFTGTATTGALGKPDYDYLCDFTSDWVMGKDGGMAPDLVGTRWDATDGTLAHEMGHNLGCSHDAPGPNHKKNTYSYGWASTNLFCRGWTSEWPGFFTIMSGGHAACECTDQCKASLGQADMDSCYVCKNWDCCNVGNPTKKGCLAGWCGDYALNAFSTPKKVDPVWGAPLGKAEYADNASQLEAEWKQHANFRTRGVVGDATAPRGVDYFECADGQCWYKMHHAFTWGYSCDKEGEKCQEEHNVNTKDRKGDGKAQSDACNAICAADATCVGYQVWYGQCFIKFKVVGGVPCIDTSSWCAPYCADYGRKLDCTSVEECKTKYSGASNPDPVNCVRNEVATQGSCTSACGTVTAIASVESAHGGIACSDYACQPGDGDCPPDPVNCVRNEVATQGSCTSACGTVTAIASVESAHGGIACSDYACQPGDGDCPHEPVDCVRDEYFTKASCPLACGTVTAIASVEAAHGGSACSDYVCQPGDGACPEPTLFTMTGNCEMKNNCVSSSNYGTGIYANYEACDITINQGVTVTPGSVWKVENSYDHVIVAGVDVESLSQVPSTLNAGDKIKWTSDVSVTYEGWQLCFTADPCNAKSNLYEEESHCDHWASAEYCEHHEWGGWVSHNCDLACCKKTKSLETEVAELDKLKRVNSALLIALETLAN